MTIHPDDERFAQFLRGAVPELDVPDVPIPREEMWARIVAQRHGHAWLSLAGLEEESAAEEPTVTSAHAVIPSEGRWRRTLIPGPAVGISVRWAVPLVAAVLLVGVGLGIQVGYWRSVVRPNPPVATAPIVPRGRPEQVATEQHFKEVKLLLDRFSALTANSKKETPQADAQMIAQARYLLSTTQLLLDSPAGLDPQRRHLLTDIELVLMQITQLPPAAPASDRDLVERSIERSGVVQQLQHAVPSETKGQNGI